MKKLVLEVGFVLLILLYAAHWWDAQKWQGPPEERFVHHLIP